LSRKLLPGSGGSDRWEDARGLGGFDEEEEEAVLVAQRKRKLVTSDGSEDDTTHSRRRRTPNVHAANVQDADFEEPAPVPTSDSEEEARVVPAKRLRPKAKDTR